MKIFKKHMVSIITGVACVLFIMLRVPSLFEPHWYADEGIYAAVAYALESGRTLYIQIWDNKPPLLYYLYLAAGDITGIKAFSLLAGLMGVIGLRAVARRVKLSDIGQMVTVITAAVLLGSSLLEGNIANAENFFVPMVIWGIYFGLSNRLRDIFFSGLLFGGAFLLKFHPLFDFAALMTIVILMRHTLRTVFEKLYAFGTGFLVPLIAATVYLILHKSFIQAVMIIFFGNVSYTQIYTSVLFSQWVRITFFVIAIATIAMFFLKKRLSAMTAFLGILLLSEYFAALLSGRRYVHYLLQTVPGVSLFAGYAVEHIVHHTQIWRNLFIVGALVLGIGGGVFLFNTGEGLNGNVLPTRYYPEFIEYVAGRKPYFLSDIESRIDLLREYFGEKPASSTKVIYTDNPWLYVETRVVPPITTISAYHQYLRQDGTSLFAAELGIYNPDFIVVDKSADVSDEFFLVLKNRYVLEKEDKHFQYYQRM